PTSSSSAAWRTWSATTWPGRSGGDAVRTSPGAPAGGGGRGGHHRPGDRPPPAEGRFHPPPHRGDRAGGRRPSRREAVDVRAGRPAAGGGRRLLRGPQALGGPAVQRARAGGSGGDPRIHGGLRVVA